MIKEKLKLWQKISAGIGELFSMYLPLPSSFYTVLSLFIAAFAMALAYSHHFIATISLFFVAAFCDVIDGAVARAQKKASNLGAFIDGVTDRFVDFAILFSYFFFDIETIWLNLGQWIAIASFVVILPSFNVAYANHRGAVDDDDETIIWRLMNRGEMFFLMMAIPIASMFSRSAAGNLLILLVMLSIITIIQTIVATIYHAKKGRVKC